MDRLAFNAAAAINEQRISRQVTTNELANVNTTGFKRSYETALQTMKATGTGMETRYQPKATSSDLIQLTPGITMVTGNPLDVALNNATVLGVQGTNGQQAFTRRGDLNVSTSGVLQTAGGHPVLGQNGRPITVPPGFNLSINADGSLYASDPQAAAATPATLVDRLQLRDASKTQLVRRSDGLFQPEAGSGDITNGVDIPSLTPMALEGSNVSPIGAMVRLMDQTRSFEQQVKTIEESKNTDESGASMMKLT